MSSRCLPTAKSVEHVMGRPLHGERAQLQRIVAERGLAGLANDTKWDELLAAMRCRQGWRPRFRCKTLKAAAVSQWDGEWLHHLPFPMLAIEWIDLTCRERTLTQRLASTTIETDHTSWLVELLTRIGFDIEIGHEMVRMYAYSPRDRQLFDR